MKISLSKISQVLPEFVDTRLMPSAPSTMKWILGGSTFLILHQADTLIGKYLPMLKQVGIVDENNKVDIEVAKGFINSAFDKSGTEVIATQAFTNVGNVITLNKDGVVLAERDKMSCTITFGSIPASGIITPARSYLRVDNHGSVIAKRSADFMFNTIANMVFYEGIEARLQLDEASKPAIVVDTWKNK